MSLVPSGAITRAEQVFGSLRQPIEHVFVCQVEHMFGQNAKTDYRHRDDEEDPCPTVQHSPLDSERSLT